MKLIPFVTLLQSWSSHFSQCILIISFQPVAVSQPTTPEYWFRQELLAMPKI